jgi:hypothetical protein
MTAEEQSHTGAAESNVGLVDGATLLAWIDEPERHLADASCRSALTGPFPQVRWFGEIVAVTATPESTQILAAPANRPGSHPNGLNAADRIVDGVGWGFGERGRKRGR